MKELAEKNAYIHFERNPPFVQVARRIVSSGREYAVDIDLSKFFNLVNQDRLMHRLKNYMEDKNILRIIENIFRSGVMEDGLIEFTTEGTIQGSSQSPLISNEIKFILIFISAKNRCRKSCCATHFKLPIGRIWNFQKVAPEHDVEKNFHLAGNIFLTYYGGLFLPFLPNIRRRGPDAQAGHFDDMKPFYL